MRFAILKPSAQWWKKTGIIFAVSCFIGSLFFFKLGTLVGTAAGFETPGQLGITKLSDILANPLYAPHKLGQYLSFKAGFQEVVYMRAVSAAYAFLFVWMYYAVLKVWFTTRIALFGTLLFATSSWTLHVARIATPEVMHLSLIALLAFGVWSINTSRYKLRTIIGIILVMSSLYIPGFIWFIVPILLWQHRRIIRYIKASKWQWNILFGLFALVLIAPLLWGLKNNPGLVLTWAGLPSTLPSIPALIGNILRVPSQLFIAGLNNPSLWLGKSPILDIFTGIMTILGGYSYFYQLGLDRSKTLIYIAAGSTALMGLSGQTIGITLIFPLIYVLAASGIALMLQQWFTIFPRNPVAKNIGASVLTIAVLVTVFYHVSNYFIAWPNAPETRKIFGNTTH